MNRIAIFPLAAGLCVLPAWGQSDETVTRWKPSLTLQTGLASTFQLTLGGTFGKGPAWQNRATVTLSDTLRDGDAIVLSYWMTRDFPGGNRDWIGGAAYRLPRWARGKHSLTTTLGWQRWLFPSVLKGACDHLASANAVYRTTWRFPITVTADNWALLKSPLRRGNLLHVQAAMSHKLWSRHGVRVVARHGPSTTYSWNFYDRPGWRVFRYGGALALESKHWSLEALLRQQAAIAPRVPDNRYWSVLLSRNW